jgi:hypothetical protein
MKIVMPNKLHATIGKTIYLVRWLCAYALLKCNEALFTSDALCQAVNLIMFFYKLAANGRKYRMLFLHKQTS